MKKTLFSVAVASLALAAAAQVPTAQAQTAPAPNTRPMPKDGSRPQTEQGTGTGRVATTIPVADYFEGGQAGMYAFIAKELKYPMLAKRNRVQGRCIVSFTLNADGTMSGVKLIKQAGAGTGEEALRVVRLLKFKNPEYPILTSLPVDFKLGVTGSNALN